MRGQATGLLGPADASRRGTGRPRDGRTSAPRRRLALVLLLVFGCAVGLGLAEGALRIDQWRRGGVRNQFVEDRSLLHHRLRANYDGVVRGARFTTNSRGLRDREFAVPKPAGIFRIAVLGDSFTVGSGLVGDLRYDPLAVTRDVDTEQIRRAWLLTSRYIVGIRDVARKLGASFVLVTYPYAHQVSATASPAGRLAAGIRAQLFTSE